MSSHREISNLYVSPEDTVYQYDEMLLGNRSNCSVLVTAKENGNKFTDAILRYCFEDYLKWTPEDVVNKLSTKIVERLKLSSFISKRIPCPAELEESELQYVGWHLYPDTHRPSKEDLVIKIYMELLNKERRRYPKFFFDEADGVRRAKICLLVMINEFVVPKDLDHLYSVFAHGKDSRRLINKYLLDIPMKCIFGTPLDYLHETLKEKEIESEELYEKYKNEQVEDDGSEDGFENDTSDYEYDEYDDSDDNVNLDDIDDDCDILEIDDDEVMF